MKEFEKTVSVELDVIDPSTGESFRVNGTSSETSKYYSISKVTSRINTMQLLTVMERTCTSPKDIKILNVLLDMAGSDNKIRIDNITSLASELGVSKVKFTLLLKSLQEADFFMKLDVGVYFVNPFVWIGRRVKSNELRESVQTDWTKHQG